MRYTSEQKDGFLWIFDEGGNFVLEVIIENSHLEVGDHDLDVVVPPYDTWSLDLGPATVLRDMLNASGDDTGSATLDGVALPPTTYAPDTPCPATPEVAAYTITYADEDGNGLHGLYAEDDAQTATVWDPDNEDAYHMGLEKDPDGLWQVQSCHWQNWPEGQYSDVEEAIAALGAANDATMTPQ